MARRRNIADGCPAPRYGAWQGIAAIPCAPCLDPNRLWGSAYGFIYVVVSLIVFGVGTDKSDIHNPVGIVDPHHQPVFVTGNVKYDPAILEDAGIPEVLFYLCGGCPVGF